MKVLIVDDEPLARARLARLLEDSDDLDVVAEADNGERAIAACNQHEPDVVLMDIRMPVMDGLEAARHLAVLEQPPVVIFCTAYNDYALQAFETNAVDYLLKPVNRDKLQQALSKAQKLNRVQLNALLETGGDSRSLVNTGKRQHISASTSRGIELIPIETIRYFLADQKYTTVHFLKEQVLKEILIDEPLKDLEREFAASFVRVHRNALVSIAHIQGLNKTEQGTQLRIADVPEGPLVSRRHLAAVRELLQHM